MQRDIDRGELAVGISILALAAIVLWQAGAIPQSALYAVVGPRVVPYIVGAGLALLGAGLIVAALRNAWGRDPADDAVAIDWRALAWIGVGLVLNVVLIAPLGFIISSTLLFACVARGFGSRAWPRDAGIGLAIALVAYVCFEKLLGIRIGAGILEGIL